MSVSCIAKVKNKKGIHARPSSVIAKTSLKFKSCITIFYDGRSASAKDVLQLIMLELFNKTVVKIIAEGEDEKKALKEVKKLIEKEYDFD